MPIIRNTSLDMEATMIGSFFLAFGVSGVVGFFWKTKVGYMATLTFQYFTTILFFFSALAWKGNFLFNSSITAISGLSFYAVFLLNSEAFRKDYGHETVGYGRNITSVILGLLVAASLAILYHHT